VSSSRNQLAKWLVRRWHLKLLAGVLAFFAWIIVTTDSRLPQDYSVPVDVTLDEDAVLTGERVTRVSLRVRGSAAQLRRLDPLRLGVRLDLRNVPPGERTAQIEASNVLGIPTGMEITSIEPRVLTLNIARRLKAEIPIVPRIEGDPAAGTEVYRVSVFPSTVEVEGPENLVAALERIETDVIRLDGRAESFATRVSATPSMPDVRAIDPRLLSVRVDIDEIAVERTFRDIRVVLVGAGDVEVDVSPTAVAFVIAGPRRILDAIQPDHLTAVVDVTGLDPRSRRYPVSPRLEIENLPVRERGFVRPGAASPQTVSVKVHGARSGS
jgi:YbbR domain-containing protein